MPSFAEFYVLGKPQASLDFVDIPLERDIPLFIDPFALSLRTDRWSRQAHGAIKSFFEGLIQKIRAAKLEEARHLLSHLTEPNETHFGLSRGRPRGAGVGYGQAELILGALKASRAVQTGFLSNLEECELLVEGIARDKISDLTTNVIRSYLAEYTRDLCQLHGIPLQSCPLKPYFDESSGDWVSDYFDLPAPDNQPTLLVPKVIARWDCAYNQYQYYNKFVVTFLQAEHYAANTSLVRTLKSGARRVYKRDVRARFRLTKDNLFEFSKKHPDVLQQYRSSLKQIEKTQEPVELGSSDDALLANTLHEALRSIPEGANTASEYHNLMIGVLEFVFFPNLIYPQKEREIHEGRKRIDAVMQNGATSGVFETLHRVRRLPCSYVAFECKN
jgi:hypothetical protein